MDLLGDVSAQQCPWCGEVVDLRVEEVGPSGETYVEDCPVCCRPWTVQVTRDVDGVFVVLGREGE